jgi:hypothetical protein
MGKVIVNFADFLETKLNKTPYYNGGWVKTVKGVNKEESTGYCFIGDFVRKEGKVEVEPGYFLICTIDGSRKNPVKLYYFVEVKETGEIEKVLDRVDGADWALQLRDKVAELINARVTAKEDPNMSPEYNDAQGHFDPEKAFKALKLNKQQKRLFIDFIKNNF